MIDTINKYSSRFDDKVVLLGEAAAHLWIKRCLCIDIPYYRVDLSITSSKSSRVVVDRWLSYLHDYDEASIISDISSLKDIKNKNSPTYHIYTNVYDYIPHIDIDGISVQDLSDLKDSFYSKLLYSDDKSEYYTYVLNLLNKIRS